MRRSMLFLPGNNPAMLTTGIRSSRSVNMDLDGRDRPSERKPRAFWSGTR
jgi:hypothetical protein